MGSQNHRENQQQPRNPRFQNQWVAKTIEKTKQTNKKQDFRINDSDSRSLILISFCLFGFLDGFGYPLVLKSCFFLFFRWFWLPIGSEILVFLFFFVVMFSMVFAIPYIISAVRFLRFLQYD